jgi:hypothetical protein
VLPSASGNAEETWKVISSICDKASPAAFLVGWRRVGSRPGCLGNQRGLSGVDIGCADFINLLNTHNPNRSLVSATNCMKNGPKTTPGVGPEAAGSSRKGDHGMLASATRQQNACQESINRRI